MSLLVCIYGHVELCSACSFCRTLIMFGSGCVGIFVAAWQNQHLQFCGLMHGYICLYDLARLHQNETDNCAKWAAVSICRSSLSLPPALAISHYGLGTAALPGHSSTILSQDLRNQYALATCLIMQFILSTCCLHPNFLPHTLIPLYFCSHFLFVSPISFLLNNYPLSDWMHKGKPAHIYRPLFLSQWLTVSFRPIINNLLPVCWAGFGILLPLNCL